MKVLLGSALVFIVFAAVPPTASGDDRAPKNSAVVELIGTFDGTSVGADPKKQYYRVVIHEVVVDPNGLFADPTLKPGLKLLQLMDADVRVPKGKARLFVKSPDRNVGSWLLVKGIEIK